MVAKSDDTGGKQAPGSRRGKFPKGKSGNPDGRPKGSRNAVTLAAEVLLDGEAEALTRKCVDLAKAGDMAAMRLCLERIMPPRKSRRVAFDLPPVAKAADISAGFAALVAAMAAGELAPDEAQAVAGVLELKRRAIETADLEARVKAIEDRTTANGK